MVEPTEQLTLVNALKKENHELKEEVTYFRNSRKLTDFFGTIIWALIAWMSLGVLLTFSKYGIQWGLANGELPTSWEPWLIALYVLCEMFLYVFIIWYAITTNAYRFNDELIAFGERVIIFVRGGKDAIIKSKVESKPEDETNDPKPERDYKTTQKNL